MMIPTISAVAPIIASTHHTDILHVITTEIPLDEIVDLRSWDTGIQADLANGRTLSCVWADGSGIRVRSYADIESGLYECAVVEHGTCVEIPGHSDSVLGYACLSQIATMARFARQCA